MLQVTIEFEAETNEKLGFAALQEIREAIAKAVQEVTGRQPTRIEHAEMLY